MVKVGDKIKMSGERCRYTVQGIRCGFIIATKPFNARHTYLYTIIDTNRMIRGPLNSIFGLFSDVDTPEGATELFDWIEGDGGFDVWHVSKRHKDLTQDEISQVLGRS